jgi:hypothetical protein
MATTRVAHDKHKGEVSRQALGTVNSSGVVQSTSPVSAVADLFGGR